MAPAIPYKYVIYGLKVHSEIKLPSFDHNHNGNDWDIHIRLGGDNDIPAISAPVYRRGLWQVNNENLIFSLPEVAVFYINLLSSEIIVNRKVGVTDQELWTFIISVIFTPLLRFRGNLVLHASAVINADGKAWIFAGSSKAGKSTIAAYLAHKQGNTLLSDDICAINIDDKGQAAIAPGFSLSKLWIDAVEALNLNKENLPRVRSCIEKYFYVSLKKWEPQDSFPVEKIFILKPENHVDDPIIRELTGASKLNAINNNEFIKWLNREKFIQTNIAAIKFALAKKTTIAHLIRPSNKLSLAKLAHIISG